MKTLAERLRHARKEKGLTQAELAKAAGVSGQSLIGGLETGYRRSSSELGKIAVALGVDPIWLIEGKGSPEVELTEPPRSLDADLLLRCCNAVDDWCAKPGRRALDKPKHIELVCYVYEFFIGQDSATELQMQVFLDRWSEFARKQRQV